MAEENQAQQVMKEQQQVTKEPQRATTKNLKKVEVGKRLAEHNHKKREAKKREEQAQLEKSGVNQYYGIRAVIALHIDPPSIQHFNLEDTGKLVAIVAASEMTREYLIKMKDLTRSYKRLRKWEV